MKKLKPLLLVFCAILLVAGSVMGTIAYLTDESEVVNTFTVGNVNIRLDEAVVNELGQTTGNDRTEDGNTYHLIPGMTYTKDPTVTVVNGSESAYVRMLVTVNYYTELTEIFGDPFLPQNLVTGWDNTKWLTTNEIAIDTQNNTATYEFRYFEAVKPDGADLVLDALFDSFTIPGEVTGEQLATIRNLEISVEAHAIQAMGFANAEAAWAAFTK